MKKIYSILLFLLISVGIAQAQAVNEWYFSGTVETFNPSEADNIIKKGTKHNLCDVAEGTYVTLLGSTIKAKKALKMEGATQMTFTTTQISDVTVIQSLGRNPQYTFKFDGNPIDVETGETDEANQIRTFKLTDVPAGDHVFAQNGGQSAFFYIGVEYKGNLTELDDPVIAYDAATGVVTITGPENAAKIVYTIDGTNPTSDSSEYTAPFTVTDGVTVKAMSVGDNTTTANSFIVSEQILFSSGQIAQIECSDFNGAFNLSCATPNVKIEYKVGADPDWIEYKLPVTFFAEGTTKLHARATREGWTAATAEFDIEVPPYVKGHDEIIVGFGSFQEGKASKTLTGTIGDPKGAMGISLSMAASEFSGASSVDMSEYEESVARTAIKGSSDKEITMTIPKGMTVMRVAFFNYLPSSTPGASYYWSVKYGDGDGDDAWVTSEAVPDESLDPGNPAARVFKFEGGVKDQLVFKHVGVQPIFSMVVYVVYDDIEVTHDLEEEEGLRVDNADFTLTLHPAQSHHEIWAKFVPFSAAATVNTLSRAVNVTTLGTEFTKLDSPNEDGDFDVVIPAKTPGTLHYYSLDPTTLKQSDVKTLRFDDATGIDDIISDGSDAPVEYYNLQGQRVADPAQGNLYIVKQGNKVRKVIL